MFESMVAPQAQRAAALDVEALKRRLESVAGTSHMIEATESLYERAGGTPFFEALVERFYEGVADDPRPAARSTRRRTWRRPSIG